MKNSDKQQDQKPPVVLTYRINVAMAKLGVSRSTIYRMVKDKSLDLVKIGRQASGITAASLHNHIDQQVTGDEPG